MDGWTDGRWLVRLGQQSHSRCPGDARRSRDPLGTEGRCDSAVSREGSCVWEQGVLPLLQALGAGLTGLCCVCQLGIWGTWKGGRM